MSVLTTTTFIYTLRAGITAAAGTRLALSWLLVNGFKLFSSQILFLKGPNSVNSCHYFDDVSLSNFRSCCLPWKWRQCLRPPLRNQTLIPRHPLEPFWSKAPQTKLIDQSQVQSVERPRGSIDQPIYSTSKEWDEVLSIISFNKFTLKSSQPYFESSFTCVNESIRFDIQLHSAEASCRFLLPMILF